MLKKIDRITYSENHFFQLREWFENENPETPTLPSELECYKMYIDTAHDFFKVFKNQKKGIHYCAKMLYRRFQNTELAITERTAVKYILEATNLYYESEGLSNDTHRNIMIRDIDRQLALLDEANTDQAKKAIAYEKLLALKAKLLRIDQPENSLPEDLFRQPIQIFTTNFSDVGGKTVDRRKLLADIQSHFDKLENDQKDALLKDLDITDIDYEEVR